MGGGGGVQRRRRRPRGGGGAVAKRMVNNHKAVGIGDHIPYNATVLINEDGQQQQQQQQASAKKESVSERVRHPDEVEWYLVNQILPPISCLCEPINGTLPGITAEKLGLDSSKYNGVSSANVDEETASILRPPPHACLTKSDSRELRSCPSRA
jgi:hypothetical protein